MPTALVLDGASGPALAAVRSLGRAGWRVLVPAGTRSALSRYAAGTVTLPDPQAEPHAFRDALAGVLDGVDVVAPAGDASIEHVWSLGDALGDTRVLGADRESVSLCMNKADTLAAADRHGFPTPAWRAPATEAEAREAVEEIGTPCVVKARRSFTLADGRLRLRRHSFVTSPSELPAALEHGRDRDGSLPVVQAFVQGRSVATSAVVRNGRIVAYAARETLSFDPIRGGTSVWKRTIPPDDVGVQESLALLLAIGYEGLAEVEYQIGEDGIPRLMEIGARLHGWIPLAVAAGVDLPVIAARALLGEELPETRAYRVGVQMRWPAGELHRLRRLLSREPDLPPGTSRWDVARLAWPPWAPGMRYDGIDLDDRAPWLPLRRAMPRSAAR
jgi:predicted ATP-grasp superfamily ATP-dependent carboligase